LLIATTTASSLIESEILGFCFHIRYRAKHAYDWTIKSRGFVLPEARGCGVGTALYTAFIQKQKSHGMHSIVAVCNTNNSAAIALHRKVGFEVMGVVSQVARVDEQWQDCVYFYHMLQSGSL
jgi:phosphinothricin acetyltransferase